MTPTIYLNEYLIIFSTIMFAYIAFGAIGFGSVLIASPILIHQLPLSTIIALIAIFDFLFSIKKAYNSGPSVDKGKIAFMAPIILIGGYCGASALFMIKSDSLVLMLAIFVFFYGLHNSLKVHITTKIPYISKYFPEFFLLIGSIFSSLFGSGGVFYAAYLNNTLATAASIKATLNISIVFSTLTRITIFTIYGLYNDADFWLLLIKIAPAAILGIHLGNKINDKISKSTFSLIINILLIIMGILTFLSHAHILS